MAFAFSAVLLFNGSALAAEGETRLRAAMYDAAWIGGTAALDLGTTEYALSRGAHEANPLLSGGLSARAGAKLVLTGVAVLGTDHLRTHGHARSAKILRWMLVGLQVGAAVHNMATVDR